MITTCTRDCPGSCSILAHIENGKIVKLQGNPDHDVTAGFLCKNTAHYLEDIFYNSQRILHPLLKENGEWKRISWDVALDIAASKISEVIEEYGSSAILYYQGFGARTALQSINKRFFNLLGGVTATYGTVCGGIGHSAMEMDFGVKISHDPLDHLNSDMVIIWGRNPAITDVHLWRILRKAKRNGTKIVVIDPVETKTANLADIFIQPAPGSDHYLAMALAKIILEHGFIDSDFIDSHTTNFESYKDIIDNYSLEFLSKKFDVSIAELKDLALSYAQCKPASIIAGWGIHRYIQGHLPLRFMDALAAITGNIGISGGGVSQGFEEYEYFDFSLENVDGGENNNHRQIPMPTLGEAILSTEEPPIKLIFLASADPVNLNPNSLKIKKAFESTDFVIMIDHFLNDTSDVADLFLPATTFLEEENLMGSYGHSWVSPINPVVPPQGEVKSEFEIFQLLSKRLGFGNEMSGAPKKWLKKLAAPILNQNMNFNDIQTSPQKMVASTEIPFADGKFKTKSGKFEFIREFAVQDDFKRKYPLKLLSTMHPDFIGSVVPESYKVDGFLEVKVHPEILKDKNITDGAKSLLESTVGSMVVEVKADESVRKDYVLTYKGGWLKHNKCVNVLTHDQISEVGNGTPYYDTRVRIRNLD
ncbi:molybdopterin-dependent oxidoreductase [Methanobacterium alcaliphilum]|uniref:molybdopterin-dependent oxidoreductase n=1 Tax=Methanobacterium alcaliphilum TaxID=392018 RepID=UPI00200A84D1|nr:molybdopterin-dependent oxidoreductase [Methanobacterium alcaliphilum]